MTPEHEGELRLLGGVAKAYDVRSYLEIGCRNGLSLERMARFLPTGARIVAVDLPNGPWGTGNSETPLKQTMNRLKEKFGAHLILGDSKKPGIIEQVKVLGPFDLIYIDGDHTYEGVSADWKNYGSMGKIIAFDDIWNEGEKRYPDKSVYKFGVHMLWAEIRQSNKYRFIELAGTRKRTHGIGVLWV